MKKEALKILFFMCMFLLVGCSTSTTKEPVQSEATYMTITPEEAKKKIDSGDPLILLDVRTLEEYTEKHIPGSILIPNETIDSEAELKLTDKNMTLLVYCRSGNRSAQASNVLASKGYTNVFDLGGINDWPYETEVGPPK